MSARLRRAASILLLVAFIAGGCGSDPDLPDAVVTQFDVPANAIATHGASITEEVPRFELLQAVARAEAIGLDLRVVVAGDDEPLIDAKAVADTYGGTVLSYKTGDVGFRAASENMDGDQLTRAVSAASTESDMGASALAFVRVIEGEEFQSKGRRWVDNWLIIAVVLGALFALYQLRNYLAVRRANERRRAQFLERQAILQDWAMRLGPEVDAVEAQAPRLDADGLARLGEARETLRRVSATLGPATTLGELDASEIRIARAAIKLRTLRQQLQ